MAGDVEGQVAELTELAEASGHKAALRHAFASPPPGAAWDGQQWADYWGLYERAMGLETCAFSEAVHEKLGAEGRPPHRHRVYLALTERGTLVRTGWDYAKQEAVSRIVEHDTGFPLIKGAHNVRAALFAAEFGRPDVAQAMVAAGLLEGARARAGLAPKERAIQERTGIRKAAVAGAALAAWQQSDSGPSLTAALSDKGLTLAQGDKPGAAVVLDQTGQAHSLARLLNQAAKAEGQAAPRAGDVAGRLAGLQLPSVATVRVAVIPAGHDHGGGNAPVPAAQESSLPAVLEAVSAEPAAGGSGGGVGLEPQHPDPDASAAEILQYQAAYANWQAQSQAAAWAAAQAADSARKAREMAAKAVQQSEGIHVPEEHPSRGDVRDADVGRAAAWKARAGRRRQEIAIGAAVAARSERLAAMKERLNPAGRASACLAAEAQAIQRALRDEPWPRAEDRDPKAIVRVWEMQAYGRRQELKTEAEQARAAADSAEKAISTWQRMVPWKTSAKTLAAQAAEAAERTQEKVQDHLGREKRDAVDAPQRAARLVARREDERQKWEAQPAVRQARERKRLLFAVTSTAKAGDPYMRHCLHDGDLQSAYDEQRRREALALQHSIKNLAASCPAGAGAVLGLGPSMTAQAEA